ncbi:MAG TPA: sugar phosphate isomerase/epimerase family protein [Planctomycetota bacterium]|nr:sugar phosphate isomerase/epimerase family protein [Planctomycetota bacterium]
MTTPAFSRRQFLAAGAAVVSTDLGWRSVWAAQAKEPRTLVHCLSNETYSLRDLYGKGKLTHHTVAAFHKELDIRGVSLNDIYFKSWEKDYLDTILDTFKANDRRITCLIMEGNLATSNEAKRKLQIDTNTAKLKAAGYLGVPVVRMNLGGVDKGEDNLKEGVDRCVAAFNAMLPLASDLGIRITIENHGGVSGTVEGILAVIQGTDPKWVGSNLDFGNPPVNHKPEVFEKLVPHAYHTHAKLADFKENGEATNSDYGQLLGILAAAKYAGAVSVEWEGKGDAVEGVKKTRDLIRKHWPELPN